VLATTLRIRVRLVSSLSRSSSSGEHSIKHSTETNYTVFTPKSEVTITKTFSSQICMVLYSISYLNCCSFFLLMMQKDSEI